MNDVSLICLRVKIDNGIVAKLGLCPSGNYIGTLLLKKWLKTSLLEKKLLLDLTETTGTNELNNSSFDFEVIDFRQGIKVISDNLQEIGLLPYCIIGWFDNDEGIFRSLTPCSQDEFSEINKRLIDKARKDLGR